MLPPVPALRVRTVNAAPIVADGRYVLHWMTAHRRSRHNFALQHALWHALRLNKALVVLEGLRVDHAWANDRLHRFVLEGMAVNAATFERAKIRYLPYVEARPGAGKGLLAALAKDACLVTTDAFPSFFLPRMLEAAGRAVPVRLEAVDANGVIPLAAPDRAFTTAHAFRRWIQKHAPEHLVGRGRPRARPLASASGLPPAPPIPAKISRRWPMAGTAALTGGLDELIASLPIDHAVGPAALRGGAQAGGARLREFVRGGLQGYGESRNHPDQDASSGLSPWLHFGHVGAHEVLDAVLRAEDWSPDRLGDPRVTRGGRQGWWGVGGGAESFLDQLVTWRELGYQFCARHPDTYQSPASLPSWARESLAVHASDPRPWLYSLEQLEGAQTHDPVWNAAQRQLVHEGRMHNYLRMLWGKKILEWSPSAELALAHMLHLNDKYALDGRNPNSISGIFWICGRFDRAWGPERPIFGKVRYMSSDNTRKKLKMRAYLERWGPTPTLPGI